MNITIREATLTDSIKIIEFNKLMAFETENLILADDKITQGVISVLENPELGFYLVAELNGNVVGSLMITYEWSDWRNGLLWWIQSVYVVKEFRRKGIFSSLYHYVRELIKNKENVKGLRLYVEHENFKAQKTYRKLGMTETHYRLYEEIFK